MILNSENGICPISTESESYACFKLCVLFIALYCSAESLSFYQKTHSACRLSDFECCTAKKDVDSLAVRREQSQPMSTEV